jgi:PmbA protein
VGSADSTHLLRVAEQVASWAQDGEQVEAYVRQGHHTEVKVFDGEVESLSSADTEGIGVRVVAGRRQGFAYAASLDEATLAEVLAEARDNAGFGSVDEFSGLAAPDGVAAADLDLYRPEAAGFPTDAKVALALEVEKATRAADSRIRGVEAASYGDVASHTAVASSEGINAAWDRSVCSVYAVAMAGEGVETQTGYGWSVARTPEELDVDGAASDAATRTTRLLGARRPESGRLIAFLDPLVTSSLLGVIARTLSGESVAKGRSCFGDRLGDQVAAPLVTLVDDPTCPEAYGAGRFDAEGLASRRNPLIEAGKLVSFLHDTYSGRRAGAASNGSAVRGSFKSTPTSGSRALALSPGDRSQDELLAELGDGLLVQSVTGLHSGTNATSGDFSVGVEGLMVRDGALAEPVREATMASTLERMLAGVVAVGSDLEWLPGGAAGCTLVIGDVTLSGA